MKPLDVLLILVSILFATGVIVDHSWGPERRQHKAIVRFQQEQLDLIERALQDHQRRYGSYPTTEEGLEAVPGLRKDLLRDDESRKFLSASPGVRTIHGLPYVYENRQDLPVESFAASITHQDRKPRRRFSRKIEKGVFVSSVGLRSDLDRVFGRAWLDALLLFAGGVITFLALAYVFHRNKRDGDRVRGINAMIMVGIAVLLTLTIAVSEGGRGRGGSDELPDRLGAYRPDLLESQFAMLRAFRDAGVFDGAALEELERTVRSEFEAAGALPTGQPGAPGEGRGG